jgi:hypothetical protein
VRLQKTAALVFPAGVFCSARAFSKEEHEAHQEHRKNELSHNFATSNLQPLALRRQLVAGAARKDQAFKRHVARDLNVHSVLIGLSHLSIKHHNP